MRYYIKIFNMKTNNLVGYYKQTGRNSITSMKNGMKWFNTAEEAQLVSNELNGGFLRDKDKHYYTAFTAVYGDSAVEPSKQETKTKQEKEEELKDALDTFIRKNSSNFTK